ncbi:MAG TPA: hypothetical protein VK468_00960 [Pyrinomonadaceae bacterium]|nr:hypothetical protein [Pyrinomonadaceae bacterium]
MSYSADNWAEKRKSGIASFLFYDGVLKTGGPFAVVMQLVGYFILRDASQSFGQYFASSRTWITFFLHATLFGLVVGYLNWRRNEKAMQSGGS